MFELLLNLFYPKVCMGCSEFVFQQENILCVKCRHNIPQTNHINLPDNEFLKLFFGRIAVDNAVSLVYFHKKGITQELLHQLKYKNHPEIGTYFGNWLGDLLVNNENFQKIDYVIPVPIHPKKLFSRGYNQVENFAKAVAEKIHAQYDDELLIRTKYSKTQVFKNRINRSEVIDNVFQINEHHKIDGGNILLVDDLVTTGSTLESCGKLITALPNTKLSLATIAYAH